MLLIIERKENVINDRFIRRITIEEQMAEISYRMDRAKDGSSIIVILRDGREFPLHSRIDPLREAEKSRPRLDPGRHDLLIALGCGMGYHLAELASVADKYRLIIVIDILPGLKEKISAEPGAVFTGTGNNVIFLSGIDVNAIEPELSKLIDLDLCAGVQVVEHPQSFRLFPEYYDAVKKCIRRIIDKKSGNRVTVKAFGNIFLRNAINNIMTQKMAFPVNALKGKFSGSSAVSAIT